MKTSLNTLACSAAISIVLLACGNTDTEQDISSSSNVQSSSSSPVSSSSISSSSIPDDIGSICQSEDRKRVIVYDEQEFEFEVDGVYYSYSMDYKEICAKGILLNGEYMSMAELERRARNGEVDEEAVRDEYNAYLERRERCVESMNSQARDIAVPCGKIHSDRRIWEAMLTEEEIVELKETYDNISIIPLTAGNGDVPEPLL